MNLQKMNLDSVKKDGLLKKFSTNYFPEVPHIERKNKQIV